jgi:hypothetical protein
MYNKSKSIEGKQMSRVQVSWDNDAQTIARYDFDYGWTWAELELANESFHEMSRPIHHDICLMVIQNYSQHYIPSNPLLKISAMLPTRSRHHGITVVVSRSSLILSVLNLIIKVYPAASHIRFANTVEEARAMIQRYTIQRDF